MSKSLDVPCVANLPLVGNGEANIIVIQVGDEPPQYLLEHGDPGIVICDCWIANMSPPFEHGSPVIMTCIGGIPLYGSILVMLSCYELGVKDDAILNAIWMDSSFCKWSICLHYLMATSSCSVTHSSTTSLQLQSGVILDSC